MKEGGKGGSEGRIEGGKEAKEGRNEGKAKEEGK